MDPGRSKYRNTKQARNRHGRTNALILYEFRTCSYRSDYGVPIILLISIVISGTGFLVICLCTIFILVKFRAAEEINQHRYIEKSPYVLSLRYAIVE